MEAMGAARPELVLAVVLVAASAGLAGCASSQQAAQLAASSSGCMDASGAQNRAGQFQYGGAVACKTGTETFDWENPSPYAEIQYGSGITQGEISIEIQDAAGRPVYQGSATAGGEGSQATSAMGVPSQPASGTWTIWLRFDNVTGSLGIQVHATR